MLLAEYGAGHEWSEMAYNKLKEFVETTYKTTYLAEEIRAWCYEHGLERPKNERAFGGIISRAVRDGVISFAGYEKVQNVKAHRCCAHLWKRNEK